MVLKVRKSYVLSVLFFLFGVGLAWGFGQMPCSSSARSTPATECFVTELTGRLQEQVDEVRRAAWGVGRVETDIEDLKTRVGELEREVNELNVALDALGRDP